ncbi:hemolysin family protein [Salinirubellus salinus]|uniref:Hemolysin family protein n=1 Tax=Salinirubellus salinus TaxID=1364945 RepID=A0A9E7QZW6_9EURY|nr:hemolysin family protein [Salinirubellus salinus]UWM53096.1 hemolysin family protein [Salinirubellus salinus]
MWPSPLTAASTAGLLQYTVPIVGVELGQTTVTAIGVVLILLLLVGSGFFSSSEIAMFSLPAHQIDAMVEQGLRGARAVKSLKEDPHRLLVTILVGNNMVNITMSSVSTTIVGFYFDAGTAVVVSSLGITSMVLIFGESAPKSYAVENTEVHARRVARGLKVVEKVLWPLITLFYYLTGLVNRVTGGNPSIESTYVTRDEIRNIIKTGEREGVLDEEERQMLQRALRFTDASAKEVMTPRLDMAAVSGDATVQEAVEQCIQSGHARLPAYEGSLDDVIGVFDIRNLEGVDYDGATDLRVRDVVTPPLHVPESKNVDELLSEMRENRLHMVIVIDEFGATEGLITMEDVLEEIVGEILVGGEEHPLDFVDDTEVLARGEVNIDEVNEALGIDLPEGEEFETIAGFIFNRAGRLVEQGETFEYENVTLRAEQVEDTRIQKVRVTVDREVDRTIEEGSSVEKDDSE